MTRSATLVRRVALPLLVALAAATLGGSAAGASTGRASAEGRSGSPRPTGAVAVGGLHTCALGSDGTAVCWGSNADGQLGDGTTEQHLTPVPVSGVTDAVAIAAGRFHTCALRSSGTVECWGSNADGQVGDGTTE